MRKLRSEFTCLLAYARAPSAVVISQHGVLPICATYLDTLLNRFRVRLRQSLFAAIGSTSWCYYITFKQDSTHQQNTAGSAKQQRRRDMNDKPFAVLQSKIARPFRPWLVSQIRFGVGDADVSKPDAFSLKLDTGHL